MRMALAGVMAIVASACAPALREPPPVSKIAPGSSGARSAAELVHAADAAWARRADPRQAEAAQALYLDAATADERRVDALLGAMRAMTFRIERDRDASVRARLAQEEVQLGQWCQRRAPAEAACDYRLAIALGQQARERPSTGKDALGKMVGLLRKAIAAAPALDSGGPHRVLALVLLRAPGWPMGPGDPEAALEEARARRRPLPRLGGEPPRACGGAREERLARRCAGQPTGGPSRSPRRQSQRATPTRSGGEPRPPPK